LSSFFSFSVLALTIPIAQSDEERKSAINAIKIDDASVADLALDFTLPGYEIPLKAGGVDIPLDIHNVEEYVQLVIEWTLQRGVEAQVAEFKKGFSSGSSYSSSFAAYQY
jgi:E3 ubiquitin-protein ligase TRIP12